MSTAKKILGNTIWQVAGRGVMAVASIVIMKAVSRFLSVEGYGAYTAVYEFLAFFGIAADFGLFTIGVREISRGERERNFVVQNIFGMRLFTATLMMGLAVICVFFMPKYEDTFIPLGVSVAAIAVFLAILQGTVSSILQVELKMQYATLGLVAGKIISMFWILAVVFVFYVGEPSQGAFNQLMLAGVVGNLFAFLYTFYYALRFAKLRPRFCRAYWKEILVGAFPYGLALMFNAIYFRVDSLLLLQFKGVKELGFYGPPMRILEILNVIPVYFMNSVLPVLSKEIREGGAATLGFGQTAGETGKAVRIIQLCFNFLFLAGLPMAIGLYILAYPIIFMVAQPEFLSRLSEGVYGSDVALQILVVSMFFAFLNSVFNYALIALSKQNFLLWINGGAAILNVLVNVAVIPVWGFRGAAITSIFTEIFILVAAYFCARRFIRFRFDFLALVKITAAGAVMGLAVWLLREPSYGWLGMQNLNVLFLSVLGAVIYGGLIWVMRVVPREVLSRDV
ncbi:MAG: flippase [Candidatus Gracilibacteria bacterium]|jgi:O-antigen/teichoic acid export membrane protein